MGASKGRRGPSANARMGRHRQLGQLLLRHGPLARSSGAAAPSHSGSTLAPVATRGPAASSSAGEQRHLLHTSAALQQAAAGSGSGRSERGGALLTNAPSSGAATPSVHPPALGARVQTREASAMPQVATQTATGSAVQHVSVPVPAVKVDLYGAISVVPEGERVEPGVYKNVDGHRFEDGRYARFTQEISAFIPKERQYTDAVRTFAYGTDASFYRLNPKMVVKVHNEEDVRRVLPIAKRHGVPVTFRAAGTSLSGQALTDSVLLKLSHTGKNFRNFKVHVSSRSTSAGGGEKGGGAFREREGCGAPTPQAPHVSSAPRVRAQRGWGLSGSASVLCCEDHESRFERCRAGRAHSALLLLGARCAG